MAKKFEKVLTRLARESIDFQRDGFGKRMEAIIEKMRKYCRETKGVVPSDLFHKTGFVKELEQEIHERLGIKVGFFLVGRTEDLAVDIPFLFMDHIFRESFSTREVEEILSLPYDDVRRIPDFFTKQGTVDLKNAKLSGAFSEIDHPVYCNFLALFRRTRLTNGQITAILLHELGHVFTQFEYANRLTRTNQVLASLGKTIKAGKKASEVYELKELKDSAKLTDKEIDSILNSDSNMVLGYKLFRTLYGKYESDTKIDIYNQTSSEQLADNFAARFGYGREIVTSLDELDKSVWENIRSANKMYRIWIMFEQLSIFQFALILIFPMAWFAPAISVVIGATVYYLFFILLCNWIGAGTSKKDFTYDETKIRYKRVRDQYIEMLQQIELPKSELSKIINDIKVMDDIIARTERSKGLFDTIKDILFKKDKEAVTEMDLQQLVESLTHNDLLLKSAEFKLQSM